MTDPVVRKPINVPGINYCVLSSLYKGSKVPKTIVEEDNITEDRLTKSLVSLEDAELIRSEMTKTKPRDVEYSITNKGKEELKKRVLESLPHAGNYLEDLKLISPEYFEKLNKIIQKL